MRFSFLFFLAVPLALLSKDYFVEPWGYDAALAQSPPPVQISETKALAAFLAQRIIRFHQTVLSPVDGPRSHFRPSSSQYMQMAIEQHGFFTGYLMGCDRLIRENDETWVYRTTETADGLFKYDPPKGLTLQN